MTRVLFVSKPIVPPWNDGSKNLVRDVASHLARAKPTVLANGADVDLPPHVEIDRVYRDAGSFAPGLFANARVLLRLLKKDGHDIWHFVFAPNPASSVAARAARTLSRFRGAVVQTIASRPKTFREELVFGDMIVALSEWTRDRLIEAGTSAKKICVIPPCAPRAAVSRERIEKMHARYGNPIVLYPGDYEVSTGARTVARAAPKIGKVVFACREKTPRAAFERAKLRDPSIVHAGEVDDMQALVAASSVVVFPVDDLYGKVDLPLVLLEALAHGVPLVLAKGGPLEAITSARFVEPKDSDALAKHALELLESPQAVAESGKELYECRYTPERIAALYDDLYDVVLKNPFR